MNERAVGLRRIALLCTTTVAIVAFVTGCGHEQKSEPIDKICLKQTDRAAAMEAAEDVLARMHFTIDKSDPGQGIMTTRPLSGAQLFEFWRKDVVGTERTIESNIHSTQKVAELTFASDDTELCIDCTVSVYRLSMPGHDISSGSQAYAMFSRSTSLVQVLEPHEHQRAAITWHGTGEDAGLADVILRQIEQKLSTDQEDKK